MGAVRNVDCDMARVNMSRLHEEIEAQLGPRFIGVSTGLGWVRVHLAGEATEEDEAAVKALAAAHDPEVLTAEQQARAQARAAPERARLIPGWAVWDEDEAVEWINSHVTDLASAKQVLTAMARMLVALRDAQWPGLTLE